MRPLLLITLCLPAVLTAARTYHVDGVLISLDATSQTVTISHRPIKNYMAAMMMPFSVHDWEQVRGLQPGNRIEFDLVVDRDSSYIAKVSKVAGTDLPIPKPPQQLMPGDLVPDFWLTDQDGRKLRFSSLRGRVIAVNFLYTRCPLPDVCPRLAANFAALQRRFPERAGKDLILLSITIDPEYDTPAVLRDYARRWSARPGAWFFLTGPLADTERISGYFGLVSWAEEGTLSHTSSTAVVSREGKLVGIVEGSTYRLNQLVDLVQSQLGGAQ